MRIAAEGATQIKFDAVAACSYMVDVAVSSALSIADPGAALAREHTQNRAEPIPCLAQAMPQPRTAPQDRLRDLLDVASCAVRCARDAALGAADETATMSAMLVARLRELRHLIAHIVTAFGRPEDDVRLQGLLVKSLERRLVRMLQELVPETAVVIGAVREYSNR